MEPSTGQRRLAAIMFTDMVGFSALAQRDEALALELLDEHRQLLRPLLARHAGREVKTTGDGFLVEFGSALAAVQAAVAMQQVLHERNRTHPPARAVQIRIGIHLGDVVSRDGDIHGDGVNIAARLEPLASPGGICVSNAVGEQVRNKIPYPLGEWGRAELKNIDAPVMVHRVVLPWLPTDETGPIPARSRRRSAAPAAAWSLGLGAVSLAVLATLLMLPRGPRTTGPRAPVRTLAVLPFLTRSTNTEDRAWAFGATRLLIIELAKIKSIEVKSMSAIKEYTQPDRNEIEIGRQLQVDAVIDGRVERAGDEYQVETHLIEVATKNELSGETHRRPATDQLAMQEHLAVDVARAIRAEITPEDRVRLSRQPTRNPRALQAFNLGYSHWLLEDSESISNALRFFTIATQEDPNYGEAWAGIASVYTLASGVGIPFSDAATGWRDPAERAIRLEPTSPFTLTSVGMCHLIMDRNWTSAGQYLRRAIEIAPKDALAQDSIGNYFYARGELKSAVEHGRKAVDLEPTVFFWWLDYAWFLNAIGQHQDALQAADAGLRLVKFKSALGRGQKGWSYLFLRQYDRALEEFRASIQLESGNPAYRFGLGCALARSGQTDAARGVLADMVGMRTRVPVGAAYTAGVLLALGEREQALGELERGVREHDTATWWLAGDPWFGQLRGDARFEALLAGARTNP